MADESTEQNGNVARKVATAILRDVLEGKDRPADEVLAKGMTALAYAAIYIGDAIGGRR